RRTVNDLDREQILQQVDAIASTDQQFKDFDRATTNEELEHLIITGNWGRYFDGVERLENDKVAAFVADIALSEAVAQEPEDAPLAYPLEVKPEDAPPPVQRYSRERELADPEVTKVKRQRRNLAHKELLYKLDSRLRELGAVVRYNPH